MTYLFGDTDTAARRLQVLAAVYAASSRAFLEQSASVEVRLAVDLGCGPGYTTHLLAEVLQAEQTVGLDNSARFIALARQTQTAAVSFRRHDVCTVPFPLAPADLQFCRLLLTHLEQPQACLAQWATQLRPHGLLLVEEVEWIETGSTVFRRYLAMQQETLVHQCNQLYIGPVLHAQADPDGLVRRASQVRQVAVSSAQAATMFWLNLQTWAQRPFVQTRYPVEMVRSIGEELQTLMQASESQVDIVWGLRQLVYKRV